MTAIAANVFRIGPCALCGWEGCARTQRAATDATRDHFTAVHPEVDISGWIDQRAEFVVDPE
jgi:hypothetical protein